MPYTLVLRRVMVRCGFVAIPWALAACGASTPPGEGDGADPCADAEDAFCCANPAHPSCAAAPAEGDGDAPAGEGEGEGEGEEPGPGEGEGERPAEGEGEEGEGGEPPVGEGEGEEGEGEEGEGEGGPAEGEGEGEGEPGPGEEGEEGEGEGQPADPCPPLPDVPEGGTEAAPAPIQTGNNGPFHLRGQAQWFTVNVQPNSRLAIAALDRGDPFYVTDLRLSLPDQGVGPVGGISSMTIVDHGVAEGGAVRVRVDPTGRPPEGALCAVYALRVYVEPMDAACADDPLEDNDDAGDGGSIPTTPQGQRPTESNRFPGMQLCPGDEDWHGLAWEGLALEQVYITLRSDDIADLSVQWVQANGQAPPGCGNACLLPEAVPRQRLKTIALIRPIAGGQYFVRVHGTTADAEGSYDLDIRYVVGAACIEDRTQDVSFPYVIDEVELCDGASHRYCFDHPGGGLSARARVEQGGDVAIRMRDAGGQSIGVVDDVNFGEECLFRAPEAGRVCVEIEAMLESTYDLVIDDVDCD